MQIDWFKKVLDFINLEIFQSKCVFIDSRILFYGSNIFEKISQKVELYDFLQRESKLNSIWIVIPDSLWFSLWAFYPWEWHIRNKYEDLLKEWIELDIFVVPTDKYEQLKIINLWKFNFSPSELRFLSKSFLFPSRSLDRWHDLLKNYNEKWILYLLSTWWFRFLNAGLHGSIKQIIRDSYHNINLLIKFKNFLNNNEIIYSDLLMKFFIPEAIFKTKIQLLFFSLLLKEWYSDIEDIATWKILKKDEVEYIKNISLIEWSMYSGFVEKVYNKDTANSFLKWNIMIAKNTNPEFLNAFYNAKMVCADTKSELSHAAITCRELKIPLALWCDNLFFSVENNDFITVNTKEKIIKIWKHDSILK